MDWINVDFVVRWQLLEVSLSIVHLTSLFPLRFLLFLVRIFDFRMTLLLSMMLMVYLAQLTNDDDYGVVRFKERYQLDRG